MTKLPELLESVREEIDEGDVVPDVAQTDEIERLSRQIPKIIAILPDIFQRNRTTDDRHVAALEQMTKDLLKLLEKAQPLLLVCFNSRKIMILLKVILMASLCL